MVLSDENIIEFQDIYKKSFGKEISKEDAYEEGMKLLQLMSIVYKPITQKEFDPINKSEQKLNPLT